MRNEEDSDVEERDQEERGQEERSRGGGYCSFCRFLEQDAQDKSMYIRRNEENDTRMGLLSVLQGRSVKLSLLVHTTLPTFRCQRAAGNPCQLDRQQKRAISNWG